ncbi:hypothetical protein [Flexivirga oryzae]|uniref:LppX_LprAFG lipoprotein n=1 Tax=Flexivirga oryzae TaxID=1794944 RepID=A0A839NAW8_9MICO|nr:hypothetical protein [Flexivirga oryzae]MBB2893979.1 hypothetical protein [Flexivirga oryzae]
MRTVTRLSQVTTVAALGFALAACGSSSSSGNSTSAASQAGTASSAAAVPATSAATAPATADGDSAVPDATTLIHQARAAYKKADSAAMHADVTDSGEHEVIDLKGTMDGSNQEATFETAEGNTTIRTVDSKYYVKGDKAFWTSAAKAPETTAQLLAGKWVHAPATMAASLQDVTIKGFLDDAIGPDNVSDAELAKATTKKTSYEGQDAYVVTSAKTKNTITIAADTKLVLEINGEQGTSTSHGKVTLSGWNSQPRVEAPSDALNFPSSAS